jgi:hypothetical protein
MATFILFSLKGKYFLVSQKLYILFGRKGEDLAE